jgi:hypothetical protein
MEICTVGSVRGESVGLAKVDLSGHEAGNGGYSQGTPTAHRPLSYSERFRVYQAVAIIFHLCDPRPTKVQQLDRKTGGTTMNDVDSPSVRESREEKRLEDRLVWVVLLCGLPLIYLAVEHASLTTLILFQAYALTATVGCIICGFRTMPISVPG